VPLNHVALTVADRERSAQFYGRHFGFTARVHEDDDRLILGAPDGSLIAVSEGSVPEPIPHTNHFGIELGAAAAVRRARERLRAAGVPETEWQDDGDFARVQVADPDGNRVEFFAFADAPVRPPRSRWNSFVAPSGEGRQRTLHEQGNPDHRVRVELDRSTLLVHLSDEDGHGWTVLAVERASRRTALAQGRTQLEAAEAAFELLYPGGPAA
jgi:catechol 2,3-dioxygenase-like lactoylglutathione lyase family enzyme